MQFDSRILIAATLSLALAHGLVAAQSGNKPIPPIGQLGTVNPEQPRGAGQVCFSEDFESGLGNWTLIDDSVPAGVPWVDTTDATECALPTSSIAPMPNWTSGSGVAACVSSDLHGQSTDIDTTMCSPSFDLSGASSAELSFRVNMQTFTSLDSLTVSVNGNDEATLLPDLGAFQDTPGSFEIVNLDSYAGQSGVQVCFNYVADWDWYVQIDDVQVVSGAGDTSCSAAPPESIPVPVFSGPSRIALALALLLIGGLAVRRYVSMG